MADLEKLAVKRDRGYLVRLVLSLAVAIVASIFIFRGLTGERTSSCVAGTFVDGAKQAPADVGGAEQAPDK